MAKLKINTTRFFLWNILFFIRYVFTHRVLLPLLIFSTVFFLQKFSNLIFYPLYFIVLALVYKTAFDVMTDTARGNMSTNFFPSKIIENEVVLKILIISLWYELVFNLIDKYELGFVVEIGFLALSTFITPAVYMLLALTNSLFVALNPVRILKFTDVAFTSYAAFVLFWVATKLLHEYVIDVYLIQILPSNVAVIISGFVKFTFLVLNFHIMGYLLFQNRDEYDLERIGFKKVEEDIIEINPSFETPIYKEIRRLLEKDDHQHALALISELLAGGDESHELTKLMDKAVHCANYTPTNKEFALKIHRRINNDQVKLAFDRVIDHLKAGEAYVESFPEDVNVLIKYAVQKNKLDYIGHLVKDFHLKYPYHEDIVPNYFLLAKQLYKNRDTRDKAKKLILEIMTKYPKDKHIPEIKAWFKGLQIMMNKPTKRYF